MISSIEANKTSPCRRLTATRTRSPGAASATKTVFPPAWANPIPPGSIRSTSTSRCSVTVVLLRLILIRRPLVRRRRRRVFLLHTLQLELYSANNTGDGVVNERADCTGDKSKQPVKNRKRNHHFIPITTVLIPPPVA